MFHASGSAEQAEGREEGAEDAGDALSVEEGKQWIDGKIWMKAMMILPPTTTSLSLPPSLSLSLPPSPAVRGHLISEGQRSDALTCRALLLLAAIKAGSVVVWGVC